MAFYSITYTLDPNANEANFKKRILSVSGGVFIKGADSQYLIKSDIDASEIMDKLNDQPGGRNKILILKLDTNDWCHINLSIEVSDWLQLATNAD
ncbi:hypothetical protein [Acinetobacter venetianus]|uniref:Uncharacterized protein n=1 Tax=Acinetobacter venetianus TaxID=52133 RepID=A0A150HQC9_9GAMM|nr:hypothetical protein [Acinetobacter venetianus]KXZ68802.1 hypothetical protein AVENLUH13518_02962 [Acinetobacter venetianus]